MSCWDSARFRSTLAALCLAASACAEDVPSAPPDAAPVALSCEQSAAAGGDPFEFAVGLRKDEGYVELSDGDEATVVLGYQGFYMLLLEGRAALSVPADQVCLSCDVELSPSVSGSFDGATQKGNIGFEAMATGAFSGGFTLIIGSQTDRADLDGAEVELTMSCDGHGLSGTVQRALRLSPE